MSAAGQPVISVDTKKKELIGEYKNGGSDLVPRAAPTQSRCMTLSTKTFGKVAPYGIYDITANSGWVSVGIDHDTAAFAVNAIRRWYEAVGRGRYENADRLLITADGGGSNGARVRLWKLELQKLADETGLILQVCHYPPGTSKWNKIEHRMFCHITQTWRGKLLVSRLAVVELIAATTTKTGLTIRCELMRTATPRRYASPTSRWRPSTSQPTHGILNGIIRSAQGHPYNALILERLLSSKFVPYPHRLCEPQVANQHCQAFSELGVSTHWDRCAPVASLTRRCTTLSRETRGFVLGGTSVRLPASETLHETGLASFGRRTRQAALR